jgi:GT2 family glycosyltransferase
MTLDVSVIIPAYRDWSRLASCLDALSSQTLPAGRFEIIVVDNEPGSARPLVRLPANARIIEEPYPGSYAARNKAVAEAGGRFLAFTDSDCIPDADWLENGLRALTQNPQVRVTGPVNIFREPDSSHVAFLYEFHTAFRQDRAVEKGRCATANLIVARDVFDRVGPFDQALVSGGDSEWGERAQRTGVPIVYEESVAVAHPARPTVSSILRKRRRIAGSEARRMTYPTFWYVLVKLLPPVIGYHRTVFASRRSSVGAGEWIILFFVHWATRVAEAMEFLFVRNGWKSPNRS